jgi:undecaprenyl pyrophosphate synthase
MVLNLASTSDLHNGHHRLAPDFIPNNVRKHLFPLLTDELDVLFIVGDFFDSQFDLSSNTGFQAIQLINELIELSIKHDFLIRVLQGTFTHDRRQNQYFKLDDQALGLTAEGDVRVKVFEMIDIEHINRLGIDILYIPDDLPYKNVMDMVKRHLVDSGLAKVDIILHHGYFEHLIPIGMPHKPHNTLNASTMSELVKGVILNGHVHTSCICEKVVTNGSFDRLAHGEEEAKGFFKIKYDTERGTTTCQFVENKDAAIFKTFNMDRFGEDVEAAMCSFTTELDRFMVDKVMRPHVFVRIISDSTLIKQSCLQYLSAMYPSVKGSVRKARQQESERIEVKLYENSELPKITEDNLAQMVVEFANENGYTLDIGYVVDKLTPLKMPSRATMPK